MQEKNRDFGAGSGGLARLSEVQRLQLRARRSQINPVTDIVWTSRG